MDAGRRVRRLTLFATAIGSAVAFLDTSVVVVALPRMEKDLGIGLAGQQWVYLAYALALSAFYLVGGAIGDRVGLRRTFVAGVVFFAAASLVTALAPNESVLVTGRALQGIGGAALTTTSLALLRVTWSGEEGRAIGLWTSLTSFAMVVGPLLGGVIVETASWRWIFLINLPLALVTVALVLAGGGRGQRAAGRSTLDVVGSLLVAVGLIGLTYGFVELPERGLAHVLPALMIGVLAAAGFVVWMRRSADPVLPPALLRAPGLAAANVVALVVYAALASHLLFVPVYMQFVGLSPALSGLAFVPPALALVLLAPHVGRYADRHGPRLPVTAGALTIALSMLLFLPMTSRADVWTWGAASILVFALGLAGVVAPITAAALSPAPVSLAGVASGVNQTVARIGGALSIAVVGALAGSVFVRAGGVGDTPFDPAAAGTARDAGVSAFHAVVLSIALFALAGAALAAALLPGERAQRMTPSSRRSASLRPSPPP